VVQYEIKRMDKYRYRESQYGAHYLYGVTHSTFGMKTGMNLVWGDILGRMEEPSLQTNVFS
jgi:hypothetical protein